MSIHVLAVPHFDPGAGRVALDLPEGMTVAEMVAMALPGVPAADLAQVRVALVNGRGSQIILPALWHRVRPRPGVQVVIRVLAAKDGLRSVLAIVVTVAALAMGQAWGLQFGTWLGLGAGSAAAVGSALIGVGVTVLGNLLINALIPPPSGADRNGQNRYSISGWRNRVDPDGAVPDVLGQIRFAPPFACMSHTEIVGDWQYVRAMFCLGYGPLEIDDMRIGETSLSEYDGVDVELRYGVPGDLPVSLMPRQIVEESIGVELTRPLPRDALGEVIDDEPGEETPVVRTTGADAAGASVILAFPAGLIRFNSSGDARSEAVSVRIEQRLVTAEEWQLVTQLEVTAKKAEAFYRQHTWEFPSRGRWQVRLTMLTDETTKNSIQRRCSWAALQTLRPEYPLVFNQPLALAAVRVKATHQLSGALDTFNVLARRVCLDWDHVTETWVTRATRNPASLLRHVLQGPANPRPVSDVGIDLEQVQGWHDFCRIRGLTYDRVLEETGTSLRDVLAEIAAAGRASPRHDGMRWGVVIDQPDGLVVDHISPRNSWGLTVRRSYVTPPHGIRVAFADATNDYKPAQRMVRWPGYEGDITLTEATEMLGVTDPAIVYRETLRRMYEAIYRPDVYELVQDGPLRVATRGDRVSLSHHVLDRMQIAARVRRVLGNLIEIDEAVEMVAGSAYAIRFRADLTEEDTLGRSVVRLVVTEPGTTHVLTLDGEEDLPVAGDLIQFGLAGAESFDVIVTAVESAEGLTTILRAVDTAPQIDALVDAAEIPAWSGRVGEELEASLLAPSAPRFISVRSGLAGTDDADRIDYLIEPGAGAIAAATYEIEHRLVGAPGWTVVTIPAANGGGAITGYASGDAVELRALARSFTGVAGPQTAMITLTVGAGDAAIPAALADDAVTVTTLLGGALVQVATGTDAATTAVQLYRSTVATLDRETDAAGAPLAVAPSQTYSIGVGDTTRSNAAVGGTMDTPAAWTYSPTGGWTISGGLATHAAGNTGRLLQNQSITVGKWYRIGFTLSGVTAGSVTPRLDGTAVRDGTARSANGVWRDRIQAVSGNTQLGFSAAVDFAGAVDDVSFYRETAACLTQGTHYLWVEPQNAEGVPGPVSGPFTITVV